MKYVMTLTLALWMWTETLLSLTIKKKKKSLRTFKYVVSMYDLLIPLPPSRPVVRVWVHFVSSRRCALYVFNAIRTRDDPSPLCRPRCSSSVHKYTHAHTNTVTFSLSPSGQTVQTHPALSSVLFVCLLCARMCARCGSPNCKQAVLSHACV